MTTASAFAASARARSKLRVTMALTAWLTSSMRRRQLSINSTGESSFRPISRRASSAERSQGSVMTRVPSRSRFQHRLVEAGDGDVEVAEARNILRDRRDGNPGGGLGVNTEAAGRDGTRPSSARVMMAPTASVVMQGTKLHAGGFPRLFTPQCPRCRGPAVKGPAATMPARAALRRHRQARGCPHADGSGALTLLAGLVLAATAALPGPAAAQKFADILRYQQRELSQGEMQHKRAPPSVY